MADRLNLVALLVAATVAPVAAQSTVKLSVQVISIEEVKGQTASTGSVWSSSSGSSVTKLLQGATLSLRLPDGKVVAVTCTSKTNWAVLGESERSCRIPPVSDALISAEFTGTKAKLFWKPPTLDGSGKNINETYTISAIKK